MSSRKPTLALSTPVTASFPTDALKSDALRSAASVRTPLSAFEPLPSAGLPSAGLLSAGLPSAGLASAGLHSPIVAIKSEDGLLKTPITPPLAYMDFLKLASPVAPSPSTSSPVATSAPSAAPTSRPRILHRASISGPVKVTANAANAAKNATAAASSTSVSSTSDDDSNNSMEDKDGATDSGPSTAASASSNVTDDCSCDCEHIHKSPKIARINTSIPASPFASSTYPMSAPAIGPTTFPSLKIPASPAVSNASQVNSPIRSPFSAKSTVVSPFDWEAALKARHAEFKAPAPPSQPQRQAPSCAKCNGKASTSATSTSTSTKASAATGSSAAAAAKTSIRHIREVVTRTVTYTPRMNPAPKGKKRKIECDEAAH